MKQFYSCGKLLLSAEYSVLRGARALSVPTNLGQKLEVFTNITEAYLRWEAYNSQDKLWLWVEFDSSLKPLYSSDPEAAHFLETILQSAFSESELPPEHTVVRTHLEFNRHWGLGSSSTLVHLVAQWARCDAMQLYFNTFNGSGYDVATAVADVPILYHLESENKPFWEEVKIPAVFEDTHFIYLGQKQDSQREVARFTKRTTSIDQLERISAISEALLQVKSLRQLESLIAEHEEITGELIGQPPIKTKRFPDFPGQVKSLGAWGGDFIWVSNLEKAPNYFSERGYSQCLSYRKLIS